MARQAHVFERIALGVAAAFSLAIGACYSTGLRFPDQVRSVAVPVFKNESYIRGVEFDLTDRVRELILDRADVALVASESEADAVIRGEVTRVEFPVLVGGNQPRILEGSAVVHVRAELVDRRTGKPIARVQGEDRAEFTTTLGESRASATAELIDTLAWRILLGLAGRATDAEAP
jgi:hypothetical protein